jgi:hypothetical protein
MTDTKERTMRRDHYDEVGITDAGRLSQLASKWRYAVAEGKAMRERYEAVKEPTWTPNREEMFQTTLDAESRANKAWQALEDFVFALREPTDAQVK